MERQRPTPVNTLTTRFFFDVVRVVIHKVLPEVKLRRVPMSLTIKIENEMRERGTRRPTQTVINDENENSMRKIKKL